MEQQLLFSDLEPLHAPPACKYKMPPLPRTPADEGGEHGFLLALRFEEPVNGQFYQLGTDIKSKYRLNGKLRPRRNLHVTLHSLGRHDGPDENVDRDIGRVLVAASAFRHATFEVRMDRVLRFGTGEGSNAVVALGNESGNGIEELMTFYQQLGLALACEGIEFKASFTPHVTLLYGINAPFEKNVEPISWIVRDFSLVHSHIGQSRHTALHTWPLIECN